MQLRLVKELLKQDHNIWLTNIQLSQLLQVHFALSILIHSCTENILKVNVLNLQHYATIVEVGTMITK